MRGAFCVLFFVAVGCAQKSNPVCEAGRQVACACPGGASGVQVCKEDGRSYDKCQCSPVSTAAVATSTAPKEEALVPCPKDFYKLADRLTPLEKEEVGEWQEPGGESCTPGLFPKPGWIIVFRRGFLCHRIVVDAATRKVIARAERGFYGGSHDIEVKRLATIDFDGDGSSEILEDMNHDSQGLHSEVLTVFKTRSGQLEVALQEVLQADNSDRADEPSSAFRYEATFEIPKNPDKTRAIAITGKMTKGKMPMENGAPRFVVGTKRFEWRDGKLVAQ